MGLETELLFKQAKYRYSFKTIKFSAKVTMDSYLDIMKESMISLVSKKYTHAVFGDIFLEDLRKYRDSKLKEVNISSVYLLWQKDTKQLLQEFIKLGFKSITVCVNVKLLGKEFVGRDIDEQFLEDLPPNVDVCGENGEFYTFVFDGPIFKNPIDFKVGEKVLRTYTLHNNEADNCHQSKKEKPNHDTCFWYCDLI